MARSKNLERRTDPNSGQEHWFKDTVAAPLFEAPVKSGNPNEDVKEHKERSAAEAFLLYLGWPEPLKIERPAEQEGMYDFDCTHPVGGEMVALEIKDPLPEGIIAAGSRPADHPQFQPKVEMPDQEYPAKIKEILSHADQQLARADRKRRYLLVVLPKDTPVPDQLLTDYWNSIGVEVLKDRSPQCQNIDQLWVTGPNLRWFFRLG